MNTSGLRSRVSAGLLLLSALGVPLAGQSRLYVLDASDHNYHAVHSVTRGQPRIMQEGRLVAAHGDRFMLKKVPEYRPVIIDLAGTQAATEYLQLVDVGTNINNEFHFSTRLESSYPLEEVFLVLEMEFAAKDTAIFVYEVGQLKPHVPQPFEARVPMSKYLGGGRLQVHLFVAGDEVFNSTQPAADRTAALDRMVATRLAARRDAAPQPLFSIAPEYPAALRQTGARGEAVIAMRLTPQGTVRDPAVVSASDPAFGEAAVAAVRDWRFVPQVAAGQAVETQIRLPFDFEPVEPAKAGKN